jgi:hypothetical protein
MEADAGCSAIWKEQNVQKLEKALAGLTKICHYPRKAEFDNEA